MGLVVKMPLVSVIVPVYKVKDYLRRCIDSILEQSYTSFDLILVDDGSPDECGEICDSYEAKDDRVIVIHQTNQGLSEARNSGIDWAMKNSDSEWLTFIDSDDWVHKDYLKLLFEATQKYNVELSVCNCIKTTDFLVEDSVPDSVEKLFYPEDFWCFRQYGCAWAKLYKKEHFKDIRYPKGLLYEDIFVTYRLYFMQDKLVYLEAPLYFYFIRDDSITKSEWNPAVLSQIAGRKEQLKYFKRNDYNRAFAVSAKSILYEIDNQFRTIKKNKHRYFREYIKLKIWFKYYLIKYHKAVPIKKHTNLYRNGLPFFTSLYKKQTHLLERKKK